MVHPEADEPGEDLGAEDIESPSDAPGGEAERRTALVSTSLHGTRLDKVLVNLAPEFSRSHLQRLIDDGHVSVEGKVATLAARKVRAGQRVDVLLAPTAESQAFRPEAIGLRIVHEDEHLVVLDKAAGMVVHPAPGNWSGTLLNALLAHAPATAGLPRAGIVHRLDKDTSGLMVVAKSLQAATSLGRQIAARQVHRNYLALAHGELLAQTCSIDAPIGRDPVSRVRMAVVAGGRPSRTDVRRVAAAGGFSAVVCTLHTGRTHQIRVHLASRQHPLVADVVYGGKPALGMQRQALHAVRLAFEHPVSGAALTFTAPAPVDFDTAWATLTGRSATL